MYTENIRLAYRTLQTGHSVFRSDRGGDPPERITGIIVQVSFRDNQVAVCTFLRRVPSVPGHTRGQSSAAQARGDRGPAAPESHAGHEEHHAAAQGTPVCHRGSRGQIKYV